ncbi:MAG TPA: permease-like cell division protein FtsX [Methylophilaceae bacterium]|nr:permease-like cell division protein FtsX [Methylophilaceae bacterium]
MKQWLNQHKQALRAVVVRMRHNLLATLMMFGVMGVALSLPGVLYVVADNLSRLAGSVQNEPQISLFLKLDIDAETLAAIEQKLKAHADVAHYQFVSRDAAWEQLQQSAQAVATSIDKNPLPDAYFIEPKELKPETVERLLNEMQQWPGVEHAQADAAWIKRLHAVLGLGRNAAAVLGGLLGLALIAIIGNTIRLQILTQREEIEVSQLIGATDRFIRRPFLYAGTLYGLGGGLAAWLLLAGIIGLFNYSVTDIAELYAANFTLELPSLAVNLAMIASAVILGWIASYIAVSRALASLQGR